MKRVINPKLCGSCKLRCCCIASPVNKLKIYPGARLRPIIPFPGPTLDSYMAYIKEENNE